MWACEAIQLAECEWFEYFLRSVTLSMPGAAPLRPVGMYDIASSRLVQILRSRGGVRLSVRLYCFRHVCDHFYNHWQCTRSGLMPCYVSSHGDSHPLFIHAPLSSLLSHLENPIVLSAPHLNLTHSPLWPWPETLSIPEV